MRTFALTFNIVFLILYVIGVAVIIAEGITDSADYFIHALYLMLFIVNIRYIYKSKEVK